MGEFYRDLGRRIAELRRRRGLTQERFAERASITTSYLARIETGARKPTLEVMRRLADQLGVPVARLLTEDAHGTQDEAWRGAADRLVTAARGLPSEDLDLLIEIALRFARSNHAQGESTTSSHAAEPSDRQRNRR